MRDADRERDDSGCELGQAMSVIIRTPDWFREKMPEVGSNRGLVADALAIAASNPGVLLGDAADVAAADESDVVRDSIARRAIAVSTAVLTRSMNHNSAELRAEAEAWLRSPKRTITARSWIRSGRRWYRAVRDV